MIMQRKKKDEFTDPSFPIQLYISDPPKVIPDNNCGFDEVVIILKGTALHIVDDQPFAVSAGDVFVIAGTHKREYANINGLMIASLLFDACALKMHQWDTRSLPGFQALFEKDPIDRKRLAFNSRLRLTEQQLHHVSESIQTMMHETGGRRPGYRVMMRGYFMQTIVFLSRCYSEAPAEQSLRLLRLGDAIAHMEAHYGEKLSLGEIAAKAFLSKRHFQRIFQSCMKRSPTEHLLNIRLRKATELLMQPHRTITDVAFECGFQDSNYFTRCFRTAMNETPRRYRQRRTTATTT